MVFINDWFYETYKICIIKSKYYILTLYTTMMIFKIETGRTYKQNVEIVLQGLGYDFTVVINYIFVVGTLFIQYVLDSFSFG